MKLISIMLVLLLMSSAGYALIQVNSDNQIQLIADGVEGYDWDTAFSFNSIVEYFEDNPIDPLSNPANQDLFNHTWQWFVGSYTYMDGNSGTDWIKVDDTTGFTSSENLHIIETAYPAQANCTSSNTTHFYDCTMGKFWGTYTATYTAYDNNEPIMDVTENYINDTSDYVNGTSSIAFNSSSDNFMVTANLKSDPDVVSAGWAEKVIFWVKVNNTDTRLEYVENRDRYGANGNAFHYGNKWLINQTFTADTWTKVEIDIRDYGIGSKRSARDWWKTVSSFIFRFADADGAEIKLDGLHIYLEDPNPRELATNVILFPIEIRNYCINSIDFYFKENNRVVVFDMLQGSMIEHTSCNGESTYYNFGDPGNSTASDKPLGLSIYWNTWGDGYTNIYLSGRDQNMCIAIDGVYLSSTDVSGYDGLQFQFNRINTTCTTIKNSLFENIGDFSWGYFNEIDNIQIKGNRYTPLGATSATVNNARFWINDGIIWIDEGLSRNSEIVEISNTGSLKGVFYGRDYGSSSDRTTTFVDWKFPEDIFTNDKYYWSSTSSYTTNCMYLNFSNSVDFSIKDSDGLPISGATVTVQDKDDNIVWSNVSDVDGNTDVGDIVYRYYFGGCNAVDDGIIYLDEPNATFNPFKLTVSASGYNDWVYTDDLNQIDSIAGYDFEVAMNTGGGGGGVDVEYMIQDPEVGDEVIFASILLLSTLSIVFVYLGINNPDKRLLFISLAILSLCACLIILLNVENIDTAFDMTQTVIGDQTIQNITSSIQPNDVWQVPLSVIYIILIVIMMFFIIFGVTSEFIIFIKKTLEGIV